MNQTKNNNKKIAIIHDSLTQFGGAERVLFYLIKMFPQADVYTSLASKKLKTQVENKITGKFYCSKLSNVKLAIKYPSLFKPYFFHYYWESLNLDKYDLVISSSHSFCAHWINTNQKHISYILTTPRFLHDEVNQMLCLKRPFLRIITKPYFNYLRKKNLKKMKKINYLLTDSFNVKNRIKKYYDLDAEVVYPPVDNNYAPPIKKNIQKSNNYLFYSRLVEQKGIDLVIKAFNQNKKPLLVVGTGPKAKRWQAISNNNIKFLGFVPDSKMAEIFQQSQALIYASIDEDFGMVPVEAMSHGLPVIAYKSGGVVETVVEGKTGLFFTNYTQLALNKTINQFEKIDIKKEHCINRAKLFNANNFKNKIMSVCSTQF